MALIMFHPSGNGSGNSVLLVWSILWLKIKHRANPPTSYTFHIINLLLFIYYLLLILLFNSIQIQHQLKIDLKL